MDGKAAAGVVVRLYPLNEARGPAAPRPSGTTGADGVFRLRMDDGHEGAPEGQYRVGLEWPAGKGGADRLDESFADPEGSGLTAVIDGTTSELPPFAVPSRQRRGRGRGP